MPSVIGAKCCSSCLLQNLRASRERVACRRVSSFSQSVVTQGCLLAPGVEHGLPPLLLKVLQARRETQLAATLGNASLQCECATPACTALARHLSDLQATTLSLLTLIFSSRPHFALMALGIASRVCRSHCWCLVLTPARLSIGMSSQTTPCKQHRVCSLTWGLA